MISLNALKGETRTISDAHQTWHFHVQCPKADLLYLVAAMPDGSSLWHPMRREPDGQWHADLDLGRGEYQFRYFISRGSSVISAGSDGLHAAPSEAAMAWA